MILTSVTNNGCAIDFASNRLKQSNNIILAATLQNGISLYFIDEKYINDTVINNALTSNGLALKFLINKKYEISREQQLIAVRNNSDAYKYIKDLKIKNLLLLEVVKIKSNLIL